MGRLILIIICLFVIFMTAMLYKISKDMNKTMERDDTSFEESLDRIAKKMKKEGQ